MAEAIVQLPLDGVGKKIRAIELVVGAHTVYMEGNVPYDEAGVGLWSALGAGSVALETVFGGGAPVTVLNPLFVDAIDRAARLVGIVYGNQDQLQQNAGTLELITEDTGLHTNPRRYEKDNGFYSEVVTRAGGVATALWTTTTTPDRTAGLDTTIYTLEIENSTGAAVTAWLEIGGAAITVPFHISDNDSVTIDYVGGFNTGDADVNCNASVNDVVFSIKGTEV